MFTFLGSETILSTGTSAYTLTLPTSLGVTSLCEMQPQGSAAYLTFDASAPSSVNGVILSTGNAFYRFNHSAIGAAKIVFDSTAGQLHVSYYQ